jgi:2-polyprenyl-3-methyl-5-hydroxy-6-metoxy-1,4-benzoquinol methylase
MISKIAKFLFRKIIKISILKKKTLSQKFSTIYKINYWSDSESVSGPGSNKKNTKKLVSNINKIVKNYSVRSIVDAPCGDLNWMKNLLYKQNIKYVGIDIVANLIRLNKKKFSSNNISFYRSDITSKIIPDCDLLICRDFLFHLSFNDIKKFLKNLQESNVKYFLTSNHSHPKHKKKFENKNIISGDFRKINLFDSPFNFEKNYEKIISDNCDQKKKYLILFNRKQILKFLGNFL